MVVACWYGIIPFNKSTACPPFMESNNNHKIDQKLRVKRRHGNNLLINRLRLVKLKVQFWLCCMDMGTDTKVRLHNTEF